MIIILIAIAIILIAYVFLLRCRRGNSGMTALRGWSYAHRGLHGNGVPENSLEAFRLAVEHGYGSELDVHLMADGELAVIHDASLKRTVGADVYIEDLIAEDLTGYSLEGTKEKIPLLAEVLKVYDGKAPLIIELKSERNNYQQLCKATCDLLDTYGGAFCLESFDPRCIYWLKKNRPDLIRGQLAENYYRSPGCKLPWYLKLVLTRQLENFLTVPDFVAYRCSDRKNLGNFVCRKIWGAQGVTWTIRNQNDYDSAVKDGWLPIFEGFRP